MKKVMLVFGTRPEAIKMCPLVIELKRKPALQVYVCITGQHRDVLHQILDAFHITPDYDLSIMQHGQTLSNITTKILAGIDDVLTAVSPDLVLVHGDTSTTFAAALACFYRHIPVGHVEAGLRTYDLTAPFPEEFNRQVVSKIASMHFAPTDSAKIHLLNEGIDAASVFVTGNTAIDALKYNVQQDYEHPLLEWSANHRFIILTAHRRENLGTPLRHIFRAVNQILYEYPDVKVLYPIHMNPFIQEIAASELVSNERMKIIPPLNVVEFHNLLSRCYLVLTDSGGLQEEAPALGKPVLVLRNTTERPEGIRAGTLRLVGTDTNTIYETTKLLLTDEAVYSEMSKAVNPYGDGFASKRIADLISNCTK